MSLKQIRQPWEKIEQPWEKGEKASFQTKLRLNKLFIEGKIISIKSKVKWYFAYREFIRLYKLAKTDPIVFFNAVVLENNKLSLDPNILNYLWGKKNTYIEKRLELNSIIYQIEKLKSDVATLKTTKNISEIKKQLEEKYENFWIFYLKISRLYKEYNNSTGNEKKDKSTQILSLLFTNSFSFLAPDLDILLFLSSEKDGGKFWNYVNDYLKKYFEIKDRNKKFSTNEWL